MEFIEVFLIFALCFLLRFAFVITNDSDVYVHLWLIKKFKAIGFGNHSAPKSVFQGKFAYPSLPHYLVSMIPDKHQIKAAYLLNILYDCGNIFIFLYGLQCSHQRSQSCHTAASKVKLARSILDNNTPYINYRYDFFSFTI